MNVNATSPADKNMADGRQEIGSDTEFSELLNGIQSVNPPGGGLGGEAGADPFTSGMAPTAMPPFMLGETGPANGPANEYDREAEGLRSDAADLREQAAELDGRSSSNPDAPAEQAGRDASMAQVLRDRAIALEQRADTVEDRGRIAEERLAIAGEASGIYRTDIDAGDIPRLPVEVDLTELPGLDSAGPSIPATPVGFEAAQWLDQASVDAFEADISAVAGFEGVEVDSVRPLTDEELDFLFAEFQELFGISEEELDFWNGFFETFPANVVFVDNLISDLGMETAARGDLSVQGTTTILMDSSFMADALTKDGMSAASYSMATILTGLGLLESTGEMGDGDYGPEMEAGLPFSQWDEADLATYVSESVLGSEDRLLAPTNGPSEAPADAPVATPFASTLGASGMSELVEDSLESVSADTEMGDALDASLEVAGLDGLDTDDE